MGALLRPPSLPPYDCTCSIANCCGNAIGTLLGSWLGLRVGDFEFDFDFDLFNNLAAAAAVEANKPCGKLWLQWRLWVLLAPSPPRDPCFTLSTFSVGQEFNVICVKNVATSAARGNSFPLSEQILGKIMFNLRIAVNKIESVELIWLKQEKV